MTLSLIDRSGNVVGHCDPPAGVAFRSPMVLRVRERYFACCTDGNYHEVSGVDATAFAKLWRADGERINGHGPHQADS